MAIVTIRNLPTRTYRALKLRAAKHGRSTEAEIRHLLEAAVRPEVRPEKRLKIGSELAAVGQRSGGVDLAVPAREDLFGIARGADPRGYREGH
jgi:antitoxin FitA